MAVGKPEEAGLQTRIDQGFDQLDGIQKRIKELDALISAHTNERDQLIARSVAVKNAIHDSANLLWRAQFPEGAAFIDGLTPGTEFSLTKVDKNGQPTGQVTAGIILKPDYLGDYPRPEQIEAGSSFPCRGKIFVYTNQQEYRLHTSRIKEMRFIPLKGEPSAKVHM